MQALATTSLHLAYEATESIFRMVLTNGGVVTECRVNCLWDAEPEVDHFSAWAEEERSTWFYRWDGGGLTASTRPGEEDREVEAVVASGPGSVHFTEWQGESTVTCEIPLLPQQREVAPVAILPDCHALIGIGPPELNAAQLGPPLVAQPLLHRSLRWLLTHQRRAAAERLAWLSIANKQAQAEDEHTADSAEKKRPPDEAAAA